MTINSHWPDATKHLIALAVSWILLSLLIGLFYTFDVIESSKEATASIAILYFLKVTAITFLMGSLALSLPIFIWILLNKSK